MQEPPIGLEGDMFVCCECRAMPAAVLKASRHLPCTALAPLTFPLSGPTHALLFV